ncbi:MAG: EF-hand domain-containing protein [Rhodocyclaceae bacterium]|nr:EF-hand domain-containing protein [Rhodocyclaceae bacterium]
MKSTILLSCLWASLPAATLAQTAVPDLDQQGRRGDIARRVQEKAARQFEQADRDGDGHLTEQEVATVSPYKARAFSQLDANGDGVLDWQEFVGHSRWSR